MLMFNFLLFIPFFYSFASASNVIFEEVGTAAVGISYCHLHSYLPIHDVLDRLAGRVDLVREWKRRTLHEFAGKRHLGPVVAAKLRSFEVFADRQVRRYSQLHLAVADSSQLFPLPPRAATSTRDKRQLGLLTGAIGLGLSLFSTAKMHHLESQVGAVSQEILGVLDLDSRQANATALALKQVNATIDILVDRSNDRDWVEHLSAIEFEMAQHLEYAVAETTDLLAGLNALHQGKMSTRLFNPREIKRSLRHVSKLAAANGFSFLHDENRDLLRFEVSVTSSGEGLRVFVHVPVTSSALLRVLRLNPIQLAQHGNLFYQYRSFEEQILLISDDNKLAKTISVSQLENCQKIFSMFLCRNLFKFSPRPSDSCAGAIFMGNAEAVKRNCEIHVVESTEEFVTLNYTAFELYQLSSSTTRVFDSCSRQSTLVTEERKVITCSPGCTLSTHDHIFICGSDMTAPQDLVIKRPEIARVELSLQWSHDRIKNALRQVRRAPSEAVPLDKIRKRLAKISKESTLEDTKMLIALIIGLASMLLLGLAMVAAFWFVRTRRRGRTPSAAGNSPGNDYYDDVTEPY